jgi:membrane associated rhomboid family serine protease
LLAFRRGDIETGRWWSVATYALVHPSALLLVLNVYLLALFGPRLERSWGSRRFVGFAALAALGGWVAHLFVGGASPLLGASSIGLGVTAASAMAWGDEVRQLVGGFTMRERWGAAFAGAVTVLAGMQEGVGGGVAFLAHLGGVSAAWIFARAAGLRFVERLRDGVSPMPDEPPEDQPPRAVPRTLPRSRAQRETIDDVVTRTNAETARRNRATQRSREGAVDGESIAREEPSIDAILDKISAEGIERLTPIERRILDDHSRRLRDD